MTTALDDLLLQLIRTGRGDSQGEIVSDALTMRRSGLVKFDGQPGDLMSAIDRLVLLGKVERVDGGLRLPERKAVESQKGLWT